ncbi:MAG: transcriptional regulator [Anaerolineales bacterium]|nr:transcriptional regulator [Anaerolineales bacterium]MCW5854423.1 transcriptional regulator [Anaerolineales bacterium]
MSENQALQLRAKKLGVLLRDARLSSGKSMKDLGAAIGISASTFGAIERGESSPSLPELEVLAYFLGVPLAHFWSERLVSGPGTAEELDTQRLLVLRQRSVSTLLRQARAASGLSQKDVSDRTGISASRIRRYESGETPVPLPELEHLVAALGVPLESFMDAHGPIGEWNTAQRARQNLSNLPSDLQDFVAGEENRAYLELAQRLQSISREKLQALRDALDALL